MKHASFLPGAACLLGLGACSYTDSGDGTQTLLVTATISFDGSTDTRVNVERLGAAVSGATVTLHDPDKDETLTLTEDLPSNSGRYELNAIPGYRRRLELKVESGGDNLQAKLEGPGAHFITDPQGSQLIKRTSQGSQLEVKWGTKDGLRADEVTIELDDFKTTQSEDSGSFDQIAMARVKDGARDLRVERRNRVSLDGGSGGSTMTIEYAARIEINVE